MHKKGYDKKVALKLINQYADQYNRISEENKCIRMQLKDLQSNIAINKQIIETFFSSIPIEQKVNKLLLQYKEENKVLLSSLSNLSNENEKMVKKVKKRRLRVKNCRLLAPYIKNGYICNNI